MTHDRSRRGMGKTTRFEDLIAWRKAVGLTVAVYDVSGDGAFGRDFALKDQIRRAANSVSANIAEGFGRHGPREFVHSLSIALGSLAEVKSHLHTALRIGWIQRSEVDRLYAQADEVARVIFGLQRFLRASSPA